MEGDRGNNCGQQFLSSGCSLTMAKRDGYFVDNSSPPLHPTPPHPQTHTCTHTLQFTWSSWDSFHSPFFRSQTRHTRTTLLSVIVTSVVKRRFSHILSRGPWNDTFFLVFFPLLFLIQSNRYAQSVSALGKNKDAE